MRKSESRQNVGYLLQGLLIGLIAAVVPAYAMVTPAETHSVNIVEFSFDPSAKTVAVGDSVTWTNLDPSEHTVTAADSSWGSLTLTNAMTYTQTFTQTGTFNYLCSFHGSMMGTITVITPLNIKLYLPLITRN